jgi:hypothetical protein
VEYDPSHPNTISYAAGGDPNMCGIDNSQEPGHLLVLPSGQVLLSYYQTTVEIYTPTSFTPPPNVAPIIRSIVGGPNLSLGQTYMLQGQRLNGLSEANMYGDDYQAASNYPLVNKKRNTTGVIYFANTHDDVGVGYPAHSINPNTVTYTHFDVPCHIPNLNSEEQFTLNVITNGIKSADTTVNVFPSNCM